MIRRSMIRSIALLAVLGLGFAASDAQAGFTGSYAVAGFNTTSSTGGLASPTSFSFAPLITSSAGTGGFSGVVAGVSLTSSAFSTNAVGFTFTSVYGTFTGLVAPILTSETIQNGKVTAESFYVLGSYVGGAVGSTAVPASFTLGLTQDGGPGNSISSSGTLVIPPAHLTVPEPASVAMLGLGLVALGGYGLRRRTAK
jgi:hypothetical protein